MSRVLNLKVEKDHLESITSASGVNALAEVIWNALDADATSINIRTWENGLDGIEKIEIKDNGHGLKYNEAQAVFSSLGGSLKKQRSRSPGERIYHGKEGKGRYKTLSLGDLVKLKSKVITNGAGAVFDLTLDRNKLGNPELSDVEKVPATSISKGFTVTILNVNQRKAQKVFSEEGIRELEEKFAFYYISYPNFGIIINNQKLKFDSYFEHVEEVDFVKKLDSEHFVPFKVRIIEWNIACRKKIYLCGSEGVAYFEENLGVRTSLPISVSLQSDYIESLHRNNQLSIGDFDSILVSALEETRKEIRRYLRERLQAQSTEFIEGLKKDDLYPYKEQPEGEVEKATRQVFDIVALQVNEYLPSFQDQAKDGKKFTLSLVKEALEKDASGLQKILTEVIELPKDKIEELNEILEKTSLVNIIDTMKEITERLDFLNGLELLIYDKEARKNVKERKHLHKIVVNETWIFGDDYTYGADDISLKNVLKEYLKHLGRTDFEEIVSSADNNDLTTIPDVCLWKRFKRGKNGYFENLVIELKKPGIDAGFNQFKQITSYANKVAADARFPKDKHSWTFILLVNDIKDEIETLCNQENRRYGHVVQQNGLDVFVFKWGEIIAEARSRYQYIKEKLDITVQSNEEGLSLLRTKYKEYLPEGF